MIKFFFNLIKYLFFNLNNILKTNNIPQATFKKLPFNITINDCALQIIKTSVENSEEFFYFLTINNKVMGYYYDGKKDKEWFENMGNKLILKLIEKLKNNKDYFKEKISYNDSNFFEVINGKNKFISCNKDSNDS